MQVKIVFKYEEKHLEKAERSGEIIQSRSKQKNSWGLARISPRAFL